MLSVTIYFPIICVTDIFSHSDIHIYVSFPQFLVIKVQDKDIVTSDDTVYRTQYEVKKFPVGKTCRVMLKFNKVRFDCGAIKI